MTSLEAIQLSYQQVVGGYNSEGGASLLTQAHATVLSQIMERMTEEEKKFPVSELTKEKWEELVRRVTRSNLVPTVTAFLFNAFFRRPAPSEKVVATNNKKEGKVIPLRVVKDPLQGNPNVTAFALGKGRTFYYKAPPDVTQKEMQKIVAHLATIGLDAEEE